MPPTVQALMEAGSGPILAPVGAQGGVHLGADDAGLDPHPRAAVQHLHAAASGAATSTRMPSLMAWPERLVPAPRKVMGRA